MSEHKEQEPIRLDPEKFGIPDPNRRGDIIGMTEMELGMYKGMDEIKPSQPVWLKIVSLSFALLIFVLPGAVLLAIGIVAFFHGNSTDIVAINKGSLGGVIPLLIGFTLLGAGIKIAYSNIKVIINKNHNKNGYKTI